jgi:outer membrane protein assembly factor BamA
MNSFFSFIQKNNFVFAFCKMNFLFQNKILSKSFFIEPCLPEGKVKFSLLLLSLFLFQLEICNAQLQQDSISSLPENKIIIRKILIEGNRRTRENVILRELTFKTGDSVSQDGLMNQFEKSKNQLHNLGLFNQEIINIINWNNNSVDVLITVKERWYTIPVPAFNLYDRNFNVWWVEHNHDIKWIQFGGRFYQKNLTGRNDDLRAELLFGYQQRYSLQYTLPYFDNIQKHGLSLSCSYSIGKSVTYALQDNKELIYEDVDAYQKKSFNASADVFYKPGHHFKYTLNFGYRSAIIKDTIAELNPDYFLNGNTNQQYFFARLVFNMDYRDIVAYPLKGNYLAASIAKLGFGFFDDVNIWQINVNYNHYFALSKKWFISSQNKLKISFPLNQPYNLERGVGYGSDYVSGYEYYAIDGQSEK